MKARIATFGTLALLWSLAVVQFFSLQAGSFWGETFFNLPYSFAIWFVPVACGVLGSASAFAVLKNEECSKKHIRLGVVVAAMSFLGYGLAHAIALVVIGSVSLAAAFFVAFLVFGGLVFFPVAAVFAVLASALSYWLFCPNKPLEPTR